MKTTVKITDVAKRAGVAKSTVSNVLTNKKFVSDELKEKVIAACRELDFQPNFYASALSGHTSNILALLLESSDNVDRSFYKELIIACLKAAADQGYSLLLYYNSDNEKLLNTLRQGNAPIDGAVLMSPCVNDSRLSQISSDRIDCVVIGRPDSQFPLNYVDVDNVKLVRDVCEKLIAKYGKDIYLINSDPGLTISQDRESSFAEVCAAQGIDKTSHSFASKHSSEEEGYAFSSKVMRKNSVFVTANAELALGVYRAAAVAGLKIGEDVAVFALGRSPERDEFDPPLSHAAQDYSVIGAKAVEMLIDDIRNGRTEKRELVDSKIIIKRSSEF